MATCTKPLKGETLSFLLEKRDFEWELCDDYLKFNLDPLCGTPS
jgi:hypothetical protein